MIKAQFENMPKTTGGGYACWVNDCLEVFIDIKDSHRKQRLTAVHEVLNAHIAGRVKHSRYDKMAIDIIDCLSQLGFVR